MKYLALSILPQAISLALFFFMSVYVWFFGKKDTGMFLDYGLAVLFIIGLLVVFHR